MAELMVAKSYTGAKILKQFEKGGKPYATIQIKCDRCTKGIYAIGVENGQIKPHPVANGVCFKCGGTGYLTKDVRLYTEKELESMERANERARQKKAEEQEKKMKAEFAQRKADWLEKNNFSTDGYTYIITGDSYSIKDELKAGGWRFDPVIKWHKADPAGYEDRVIKINVEDCFEGSAWGDYHYKIGAKDYIDNLLAAAQPKSTSEWIGEVGDKLKDLPVQLVRKYSFDGKYGTTTVYTFQTKEGNLLTWFSSTFQPYDIGEWMKIKYTTIKDHNEYKGVKSTVITRTKLVNIDPAQEVYDEYNWENEFLNG